MTLARLGLKVNAKVVGQGHGLGYGYRLSIDCQVISCGLARGGVQCSATESSACGRGTSVMQSVCDVGTCDTRTVILVAE